MVTLSLNKRINIIYYTLMLITVLASLTALDLHVFLKYLRSHPNIVGDKINLHFIEAKESRYTPWRRLGGEEI
jgi:hypothetical protein